MEEPTKKYMPTKTAEDARDDAALPRAVIACRCMAPELDALGPDRHGVEVRYLDQNLHRTPDIMPELIAEAVEEVEDRASSIVLGYGLCSNGIVGVKAPRQGLIVPRVHDCIALFLGSRGEYNLRRGERPGTYYLTPGWVAEEKDPLGQLEHEYIPRVGKETAEWAIREELKHYTHIALIDTGVGDREPLRARAMKNASHLEMEYEEVRGTDLYFRKLLFGPYEEEDFVFVEPGKTVRADPWLE